MGLIDDIRVDIGDDDGAVPSGVSSHELLSASHGDTTIGTPTNGGLIIGNGANWLALPSGDEGLTLRMLEGTIAWGSGVAGPASTQTLAQTLAIGNIATLPIVWSSGLGAITHLQGPSDEVFKLASASGQSLELYAGNVLRAIISPTGTQLLNTVDINSARDGAGDGVLKAGAIQFYALGSGLNPAHSEGLVYWNVDDKTLNLMTELADTSIQVGQEVVLRATNKTGSTILNSQLVYVNGAQGNRPTIQLAIANLSVSSDAVIGMVTSDIANNNTGYATIFGQVRDIDTSAFSVGSQLWLSPTVSGAFTDIQPTAPNHSVSIGYVNNSHLTEGIVQLRIINGTDLSSLHDVAISGITDGQVIVYDATQGIFIPSGIATSVGAHDLLSSIHTDTITAPATNASLIYGSGNIWNVLPSGEEGANIGIVGGQIAWTSGIQGTVGPDLTLDTLTFNVASGDIELSRFAQDVLRITGESSSNSLDINLSQLFNIDFTTPTSNTFRFIGFNNTTNGLEIICQSDSITTISLIDNKELFVLSDNNDCQIRIEGQSGAEFIGFGKTNIVKCIDGKYFGIGGPQTTRDVDGVWGWSTNGIDHMQFGVVNSHTVFGPRSAVNYFTGFNNVNYGHVETDNSIFIHSSSLSAAATDEWIRLFHDTNDAGIATGAGNLRLEPISGETHVNSTLDGGGDGILRASGISLFSGPLASGIVTEISLIGSDSQLVSEQGIREAITSASSTNGQNVTASYVVIESEDYLTFVNASGTTVVLNSTPGDWETHIIKDGIGNASTNSINVFGSGSLIDGLTSVSIASDWGAITVVYNGTRWGIV